MSQNETETKALTKPRAISTIYNASRSIGGHVKPNSPGTEASITYKPKVTKRKTVPPDGILQYENENEPQLSDDIFTKIDHMKSDQKQKTNIEEGIRECKNYFLKKIKPFVYDTANNQQHKNEKYKYECANLNCKGIESIGKPAKFQLPIDWSKIPCNPLQRILVFLEIYKKFMKHGLLWRASLSSVFSDDYGHQQLQNDFLHVLNHCNKYEDFKKALLQKCVERYKCMTGYCLLFERHYRERNHQRESDLYFKQFYVGNDPNHQNVRDRFKDLDNKSYTKVSTKTREILTVKDIIFQQECDKIHSYFCHHPEYYLYASRRKTDGVPLKCSVYEHNQSYKEEVESDFNQQTILGQLGNDGLIKPLAHYLGKKEDEKWYKSMNLRKKDDEIYNNLAKRMGIFRWNRARGFKEGVNRACTHWKAKFEHIKEEALSNKYEPISVENWNQTLRKSKIFHGGVTSQRIKTRYRGYFIDYATQQSDKWEKRQNISLKEVLTMKLYTDFDRLQFALKKCFRFENNKETSFDLEERICSFYHWRGALLIALNKYGTKMSGSSNKVLYHGINAKMLLDPSETFSFYGPLSTTVSAHVAKTFATPKGMVLKITSQFPRADHCNAFDASTLSDYPEEQEWLIGFCYVRILQVQTSKKFMPPMPSSFEKILTLFPLCSWMRQEFFVIHLFKQQIFSMSQDLALMLCQFLKVRVGECCDKQMIKKYKVKKSGNKQMIKKWKEMDKMNEKLKHRMNFLCVFGAKHRAQTDKELKKRKELKAKILEKDRLADIERHDRLMAILWNKFVQICENEKTIKFDVICDELKIYFMDQRDEKKIENGEEKWIISFEKICSIYPKAEQLIFLNYEFEPKVSQKLRAQLQSKQNKLQRITFSNFLWNAQNKVGSDAKDEDEMSYIGFPGWRIMHVSKRNMESKVIITKIKETAL